MRKPDHVNTKTDQLNKLGYETSDVSLPTLIKWIIFLFMFIGITSVVTWLIYLIFVPGVKDNDQTTASTVNKLGPDQPALQVHPRIDLKEFRAEEEAKIDHYGWVDKKAGIVHLPIDVTLEKVAASGALPKADPGAVDLKPNPSVDNNASGTANPAPGPVTPGGTGGPPGGPAPGGGMVNGVVPGGEAQQSGNSRSTAPSNEPGTTNNPSGRVP
jgi:hypothetical protein